MTESDLRATSTARLASPVPSSGGQGERTSQTNLPRSQTHSGRQSPPSGADEPNSSIGPGHSALATAFQGSLGRSPPRHGTPPIRATSPPASSAAFQTSNPQTTYGSFESRSGGFGQRGISAAPNEDPRIVKRHLVQPSEDDTSESSNLQGGKPVDRGAGIDEDEFSSLQLQGGDITREVYRWTEDAESPTQGGKGKRSKSWHASRPEPESETMDIQSIKVPGGFRRDHIRRRAPSPSTRNGQPSDIEEHSGLPTAPSYNFISQNFLEFLTVYGHFAGEELEEDEEDGYFTTQQYRDRSLRFDGSDESGDESGESSALLTPRTPGGRRRKTKERGAPGTNSTTGAALILLKSFVGTGVLFLPRAYLNGGMLFSNLVLLGVAALSYYCFILLVNTRLKIAGSFGDIGGILYGKWLRVLILTSIALSQVGFVSAYIVFTSKSMQAFIIAVSKCKTSIDIKFMVLIQLVIFLPLSLIRDISKLGATALVADAFILLGLIYLGYYDIRTVVKNHGLADVISFNPTNWTLFIGMIFYA